MAVKPLPTPEVVRNLIDYDPRTGEMTWKARPRDMFGTDRDWRWWNARYAGKKTGTSLTPDGYLQVKLFNRTVLAHRVAWAIYYGVWPSAIVDHRNGKGSDNRIRNLRAGSRMMNQRNQRRHSCNTSGFTGVSWDRFRSKWIAQIGIDGRTIYLGAFDEIEMAVNVRKKANRQYGFGANHGK